MQQARHGDAARRRRRGRRAAALLAERLEAGSGIFFCSNENRRALVYDNITQSQCPCFIQRETAEIVGEFGGQQGGKWLAK